jgi:hypothetical protein
MVGQDVAKCCDPCETDGASVPNPADPIHPLARQMAQLITASDLDELREIVKRWVAEAPTDRIRRQYDQFGGRMLELKLALASGPVQPSQEELELALTMMLKLAADTDPAARPKAPKG